MRIAVVGSRDYPDVTEVAGLVSTFEPGTVVVSGGAPGPDTVAIEAAAWCDLPYEVIPADWSGPLKKKAGFARNFDIVRGADFVFAFWQGESMGTAHSMNVALRFNVPLICVSDGVMLRNLDLLHRLAELDLKSGRKLSSLTFWDPKGGEPADDA